MKFTYISRSKLNVSKCKCDGGDGGVAGMGMRMGMDCLTLPP